MDHPFLRQLAREAYRDVVTRQFGAWDEAVQGVRFDAKLSHPDSWTLQREIEHARSIGKPLRLHTLRSNTRAQAFYVKHAFVVTARDEVYVDMEQAG